MIIAALALALAQVQSPPQALAEEKLVVWAISDFKQHLPGPPRGFRAVHPASLKHPDGASRPVLCGEIHVELPGGTPTWMKFATLETSDGYEQWLGGSAATWCNDTTERDLSRDLSDRLAREVVR